MTALRGFLRVFDDMENERCAIPAIGVAAAERKSRASGHAASSVVPKFQRAVLRANVAGRNTRWLPPVL